VGILTQILAVSAAASHSSIWYASGVPVLVVKRMSSPWALAWLKLKKS